MDFQTMTAAQIKALTAADVSGLFAAHQLEQGKPPLKPAHLARVIEGIVSGAITDAGMKMLAALNPAAYAAIAAASADLRDRFMADNTFNQQLADYRAAVARLAQVELSVGRKAYTEQVPTGEQVWDDKLMKMVDVMQTINHPAIDPVPATIDSVDDQGNPITIPNPVVVQDEAERAAAQAVIAATPPAVVTYAKANPV